MSKTISLHVPIFTSESECENFRDQIISAIKVLYTKHYLQNCTCKEEHDRVQDNDWNFEALFHNGGADEVLEVQITITNP